MHEVTERPIRNSSKQRMRLLLVNPVPTDLRHHQPASDVAPATRQQPQPTRRAKLLRLLKQQLHPHANTQQRRAGIRTLAHKSIKTSLSQRVPISTPTHASRQTPPTPQTATASPRKHPATACRHSHARAQVDQNLSLATRSCTPRTRPRPATRVFPRAANTLLHG